MYNNNGNLDYAGIKVWGDIAVIMIAICGCAIIISKLFGIAVNDYIPNILGLNKKDYTTKVLNKMTK